MDIDNDYIINIDNDYTLKSTVYECIFVPLSIYIIGEIINYFNNNIN